MSDEELCQLEDDEVPEHLRRRRGLLKLVETKSWTELFMQGGCAFFALTLHEETDLPIEFVSAEESDLAHVFVRLSKTHCIDFEGVKGIKEVAKAFANWPDAPAKSISPEKIRAWFHQKGIADLEAKIRHICKEEYNQRNFDAFWKKVL